MKKHYRITEVICQICEKQTSKKDTQSPVFIQEDILKIIKRERHIIPSGFICSECIHKYKLKLITDSLQKDDENLESIEDFILRSIKEHEILTKNLNESFKVNSTMGDKIADKIASFGGSWSFIILFFTLLIGWMTFNSIAIFWKPFDPYPFILLNLFLSSLAAFQAPIIMMSQNRQATKDRLRAENEYKINLKAEMGIQHVNEKIDHLIEKQCKTIVGIQRTQLEIMSELLKKVSSGKSK